MAPRSNRPKRKPFFFWGLAVIGWFLLPLGSKIALKSSFDEFHAPIWNASVKIRDLSHYWGHLSDSKNTLIEKGRDHARILSDARLQISRKEDLNKELEKIRNLKNELEILEKSLNLSPAQTFSPLLARVTLRSLSGWSQNLIINKGRNFNLSVGNAAIFSEGVVGKLEKVNGNSSKIQLLTNSSFRVVAHIKGDDRPITYRGGGVSFGTRNLGFITDVPQDVRIPSGGSLEIISSSLGGSFPKGLKIGNAYKLEPSTDGIFQTAEVILSNKLNVIEEITVLRK